MKRENFLIFISVLFVYLFLIGIFLILFVIEKEEKQKECIRIEHKYGNLQCITK